MITRGIEEYVSRDWSAARRAKDRYWAERIGILGPSEGFRIVEELRRQVLLQLPSWPTAEERRADFAAHERLSEALGRADAILRR